MPRREEEEEEAEEETDLNFPHFARRVHSAGDINSISPNVVLRLVGSNDTGHHWSNANACKRVKREGANVYCVQIYSIVRKSLHQKTLAKGGYQNWTWAPLMQAGWSQRIVLCYFGSNFLPSH